jgi:excisionase family DNA binding protein
MGVIVVEKMLLTPEDVAKALSMGRTKVYQLIMSGAIESISIGRSRRVERSALERFIRRLKEESEQAEGTRE